MSNIAKLNQKLPILNYNRNKNDTLMITKYVDSTNKGGQISNNIDNNINEEERKTTKSHNYNTRSANKIVARNIHLIEDDELFGDIEHSKCVWNALKDALSDNEKVSINIPIRAKRLYLIEPSNCFSPFKPIFILTFFNFLAETRNRIIETR
jgi:hypothetical protein